MCTCSQGDNREDFVLNIHLYCLRTLLIQKAREPQVKCYYIISVTILNLFQSPYIIFRCNTAILHILFLGELSLSKPGVLLRSTLFTGCVLGLEHLSLSYKGSPAGPSGKEPAYQCRRWKRFGLDPWVRKIPWRRAWQPTPVFWRILWTEEAGRLQSIGLHRVWYDWGDLVLRYTCRYLHIYVDNTEIDRLTQIYTSAVISEVNEHNYLYYSPNPAIWMALSPLGQGYALCLFKQWQRCHMDLSMISRTLHMPRNRNLWGFAFWLLFWFQKSRLQYC